MGDLYQDPEVWYPCYRLTEAGATYVDCEVVRDGHLVAARTLDDLPAFMRTFLDALQQPATPSAKRTPSASAGTRR